MLNNLHEFRHVFKKVILENFCNFENIEYDDQTISTAVIEDSITGFDEYKSIVVVQNALDLLNHICGLNLHKIKIDEEFYCDLNKRITDGALDQDVHGEFRTKLVKVDCMGHVPVPKLEEVKKSVDQLDRINKENYKEVVTTHMLRLMKLQPFENGNKRTALFLANCSLIKHDLGLLYFTKKQYQEFRDHLRAYYMYDDKTAVKYVTENCFHAFKNVKSISSNLKKI